MYRCFSLYWVVGVDIIYIELGLLWTHFLRMTLDVRLIYDACVLGQCKVSEEHAKRYEDDIRCEIDI